MVVIGGNRGVGRRIVEFAIRNGARVLAVAPQDAPLRRLALEVSGAEVLTLDAADAGAPSKVFDVLQPAILVLCAGAFPPAAPLHELSWREFSVNWETDVKIRISLLQGGAVAAPARGHLDHSYLQRRRSLGSPNSGGYAGAQRTQMFMANYSQKESDRMAARQLRARIVSRMALPDRH